MKESVMGEVVHLKFSTLPAEYQIAVDVEQRLLSLLYLPAGRNPAARIIHHLKFSEGGIRAIAVLLKYPNFCPFDYLLASQQMPVPVLQHFILDPSSSLPPPEIQDLIRDSRQRIDEAPAGKEREKILAPLRRAINEIIPQLQSLNLFVFNLRGEGYCMHYLTDLTYARTKRNLRTALPGMKRKRASPFLDGRRL